MKNDNKHDKPFNPSEISELIVGILNGNFRPFKWW
jgi:hypothetical protein